MSTDLVDLTADVKPHLNINVGDNDYDTYDAKLQGYVDAATAVIEDIVGPVNQRSVIEYFDGGRPAIMLTYTPVVAISSIFEVDGMTRYDLTDQPLGVAVQDNYGYTVDYSIGQVVRRTVGGGAGFFPWGIGNVVVSYTAGLNSVPANVRLATLELIAHLWEIGQQGNSNPGSFDNTDMTTTSSGYAVPNRVLELCKPNKRVPGIA